MDQIKFSQEYTRSGQIYYEPANAEAWDLMDFLGQGSGALNEIRAEKVFSWLEKLGHEIKIVQSKEYSKSVGM